MKRIELKTKKIYSPSHLAAAFEAFIIGEQIEQARRDMFARYFHLSMEREESELLGTIDGQTVTRHLA